MTPPTSLSCGRGHVVLHIEQPGDIVRALQILANAYKVKAVPAQHGVGAHAMEQPDARLYPVEKFGQPIFVHGADAISGQLLPAGVDGLPHVGGERGAHGARIAPGRFDAVDDGGGVVFIKDQKIDH